VRKVSLDVRWMRCSGLALTGPATSPTEASASNAVIPSASHCGDGRQSLSVKAMMAPRASVTPRLRAGAGPPSRVVRRVFSRSPNAVRARSKAGVRSTLEQLSTTTTSKRSWASVWMPRARRQSVRSSSRFCTEITTETSGVRSSSGCGLVKGVSESGIGGVWVSPGRSLPTGTQLVCQSWRVPRYSTSDA
jgi:hypothetical protein